MCNAGQSAPVSADVHPAGAYTCFVKQGGRIIELCGGRPGAIDRGPCDDLVNVSSAFLRRIGYVSVLMAIMNDPGCGAACERRVYGGDCKRWVQPDVSRRANVASSTYMIVRQLVIRTEEYILGQR